MYPYDIDPASYQQGLLQPYTPQHNNMPQMTPASYHGPAHQALTEAFHAALGRQSAAPGLLSAMTNDPALASQVGGFGLLGGVDLGNTNATQIPKPWNYQEWLAAQPKAVQAAVAAQVARSLTPSAQSYDNSSQWGGSSGGNAAAANAAAGSAGDGTGPSDGTGAATGDGGSNAGADGDG